MKKTISFLTLLLFVSHANAQGKIVGSLSHSMAICLPDSTAWSWGFSHIGQNNPNYLIPYPVWADSVGGQLQKAVSISTYYSHAIAALSDGTVWAWGQNTFGQLGDSLLNTNTNFPVQMRGEFGYGYLDSIIEVSCGYYHSLMLKSNGTVWSCGYNSYGQLGVNSTQSWSVPKPVLGPGGVGVLTNVIQIDAGSLSSVALRNDGTVWAWGNGDNGTMGSGGGNNYFPKQVPGLPQITKISIKGGHVLALDLNGELWSWGQNNFGQIGNNTFTNVYSPVQVLDQSGTIVLSNVEEIGTGMMHSFAIQSDGTAISWGANNYGQLGDGTTIDRYIPVKILGAGGIGLLTDIVELEGGNTSSVARKLDGTVYSWGYNYTSYPEVINGICRSFLSSDELNGALSNQIDLVPNPVFNNSSVKIMSEGNIDINSISIYSLSGQLMKTIERLQVNEYELELYNYSPGVYLVTIGASGSVVTKKLLVQ